MKKVLCLFVFLFSLLLIKSSVKAWSEYTIGQEVEYNGIKFYVIKDSSSNEDSVTMLKKEPLTSSEISSYISTSEVARKVNISGTYAKMAYYSRDNCVSGEYSSGCSTDYSVSDIKQVVDIWANQYTNTNDLVTDSTGYKVRLLTLNELKNAVELESIETPTNPYYNIPSSANWLYNNNYWYWTMTPVEDSSLAVWLVYYNGNVNNYYHVYDPVSVVRPVITLSKIALGDIDESIIDEENNDSSINNNNNISNKTKDNNGNTSNKAKDLLTSTKVKVPNTYLTSSIIIIILGFIIAGIGVFIYYKIRNKKK